MEEKQNIDQQNEENQQTQLEGGTYEIIRSRLLKQSDILRDKLDNLNNQRKDVFGSIEWKLLTTQRITTDHNCIAVDMVSIGNMYLFGYNVHFGLRTDIKVSDVLSIYKYEDHKFTEQNYDLISNETFLGDFHNLYKYYRETKFVKFHVSGVYLYMVFRISNDPDDIKTFKWLITPESLEYVDNRSDHEFVFPPPHEFQWKRTTRDQHQMGVHPHISIENIVFVETIEGDLTVKIENNTDTGEGIYAEPVDNKDQTLDDAEIYYAIIENNVILKIKPYQEEKYRYIVFNRKMREARRIDSIEEACVLLPDSQGIIFANGYYLQTGEYKVFENDVKHMLFEKRVDSPNGEDYLYVFYNKYVGSYTLLSYNLIEQKVDTPVFCHGYTIFQNGEMCYFRADEDAKRHHSVQIWQTPFLDKNYEAPVEDTSYLYKIGNKDIVRAMAECNEIMSLLRKEDTYSGLYLDLVKKSTEILDTYYWLDKEEAGKLSEPLLAIKESASSAIDEFEKVNRIKKSTKKQIKQVTESADEILYKAQNRHFAHINEFVEYLNNLRAIRGETVSLKDLRYADLKLIDRYEKQLEEQTETLSNECVRFLLKEEALQPYEQKVDDINKQVDEVEKVVDADTIEDNINKVASDLEMLIEIVSNLKIEDATETARIIDNISAIYSGFNQIRAGLRRKRKELLSIEGKAEFNAQIKLIGQSVVNYLDMADVPEKTDEYLSKLMVQLEELEGKFAEFDEFIDLINSKREEIYNAFESKKVNLIEARNKRANTLLQSAERIIKAIQNRLSSCKTVAEINGYYATDLMVEKVRDTVKSLIDLGDSVKADDIQSRLKTAKEEAIRQLKDKTELYIQGENIIKFGDYHFNVNTQTLGLTMVLRNNAMFYHLTGTGFFEKVEDEAFNKTKDVWEQTLISENKEVYRAEYLAYSILKETETVTIENREDSETETETEVKKLHELEDEELLDFIKQFMGQRYNEGYIKGVHDSDAFLILKALIDLTQNSDLLRYTSDARACAQMYWNSFIGQNNPELKKIMTHRLKGVGAILEAFPDSKEFDEIIQDITVEIQRFVEAQKLFPASLVTDAAQYLFYELNRSESFVINKDAVDLHESYFDYLQRKRFVQKFKTSVNALDNNPVARFQLIRNWIKAFVNQQLKDDEKQDAKELVNEVAAIIFNDSLDAKAALDISLKKEITGLQGAHRLIDEGKYHLNYNHFILKLRSFEENSIPRFKQYNELKSELLHRFEDELRISEFKPRILSSFVRNQLIDKVYLPLIGGNLAKQMGTAGDATRTDRMGMLLLISPPGYGKTTLMEYIANRLGIIFVKINGPAIGHQVTAIDPASAVNAAAREELEKLNLAFEMGDNVMIYLDDIQHCNPEFLQKFISLADAQRKIEGTYKGRTKTYDFRGKKVCIIMAGNPYTESGEKFRIPDMLANRADVYNLGDIIGDTEDVFLMSYIENSMTSNPILGKLAIKSHKDIYPLFQMVESGQKEDLEFEANHSPEEINEYISVLKKLLKVRQIVYNVNQQYIYSAAQADEYRTEPPFKLQGSYRDMNKLAEKIVPIMNDNELQTSVLSHYENEAQTLTTGAEANLLKYKELTGILNEKEKQRWNDIKALFQKQQKLKGFGDDKQMAQVLMQVENISDGLFGIRDALKKSHD